MSAERAQHAQLRRSKGGRPRRRRWRWQRPKGRARGRIRSGGGRGGGGGRHIVNYCRARRHGRRRRWRDQIRGAPQPLSLVGVGERAVWHSTLREQSVRDQGRKGEGCPQVRYDALSTARQSRVALVTRRSRNKDAHEAATAARGLCRSGSRERQQRAARVAGGAEGGLRMGDGRLAQLREELLVAWAQAEGLRRQR